MNDDESSANKEKDEYIGNNDDKITNKRINNITFFARGFLIIFFFILLVVLVESSKGILGATGRAIGGYCLGYYIFFKKKWYKVNIPSISTMYQKVFQIINSINFSNFKFPQLNDIPEQIKKLAELKEIGAITEDEFEAKKKDLLDKM